MAELHTVTCDRPGCKSVKGENNHWWVLWGNIRTKSVFLHPFDPELTFDRDIIIEDHIKLIACGLECLGILESRIKEGVNPLR